MKQQLILILLLLFAATTATALDFEVDGIYYETTDSYYDHSIDDWVDLDHDVAMVILSTGVSGEIIIPSTVTYEGVTYPVAIIGAEAFRYKDDITGVVIPNSVISIMGNAFEACYNLTSIIVESGNPNYDSRDNCNAIIETASNTLIAGCQNTIIPNSVTSIGSNAFLLCENLTSINFPNSVTSIGNSAFEDCYNLMDIYLPNSLTYIDNYAFNGCGELRSVTIPNSVTHIGSWAFDRCEMLTDVYSFITDLSGLSMYDDSFIDYEDCTLHVPEGMREAYLADENWGPHFSDIVEMVEPVPATTIEVEPTAAKIFVGDSLQLTATVGPEDVTINSVIWSTSDPSVATVDGEGLVIAVGEGSAIITATTMDGTSLTASCEVTVELLNIIFADANVKAICVQNWDTNGDGELSDIEAAAVTSLNGKFTDKYSITSFDELKYFTGLTTIEDYAFQSCLNLKSITLPNSIRGIGKSAFNGCSRLTSIDIPESVTYFSYGSFSDCSRLTSINIPNRVKGIADWLFSGCGSLTNIIIPNSVTSIGECAFYNCGLTNIDIPNSVTRIDKSAFERCDRLTSIIIPKSVTSIGDGAFRNCDSLASITVESGNPYYDSRENCNAIIWTASNKLVIGFKNTIIPNSVTGIGPMAFQFCKKLTSINIPNSVTSIDNSAFQYSGLTSVTIPNSVTAIGEQAFSGCDSLASIAVESGNPYFDSRENCNAIIKTASNILIVGCKNTIIPNSVTSIDWYAFSGCSGLTSIDIPNSVTVIGAWAFDSCRDLTSIDIPNSVTSIGSNAFGYCDNLTSVTIPNSVTYIGGHAFYRCSKLACVDIPNSVTYIGHYAFGYCDNLTTISIPNSVTYIGDGAFDRTRLTDVYSYLTDLTNVRIGQSIFPSNNYSIRTLHVPAGMTEVYQADNHWGPYFGSIVEMEPEVLTPGDIDGDGVLSISDLTELIDMILTGGATLEDTPVADVNGDGLIDIADVTELIVRILNA